MIEYKKEAEKKSAIEFKEKYIIEGEIALRTKLLKISSTNEICQKDGCGGAIVKLSYPTKKGDNKIEIVTVTIGICEKCMHLKKLSG